MDFEWDEEKRAKNLNKHDVDFVRAVLVFEGKFTTRRDTRHDYGEDRLVSIGVVADECFVLVWTPREPKNRLISAWKGGRDERRHYEKCFPRRNPGDGEPG